MSFKNFKEFLQPDPQNNSLANIFEQLEHPLGGVIPKSNFAQLTTSVSIETVKQPKLF